MPHTIPLDVIEKLPKTDLHVHLDGSLRLKTILDLADKQRVELPSRDEDGLRKAMNLGENCGSLVEYLKAFDVTLRVLQTADALTRTAYELAEDAAWNGREPEQSLRALTDELRLAARQRDTQESPNDRAAYP